MKVNINSKTLFQIASSVSDTITNVTASLIRSRSALGGKSSSSFPSSVPYNSATEPSRTVTNNNDGSDAVKSGYRASTPPSGVPLSRILSNTFPLSLSESLKHYKRRHQLEQIQDELLSTLKFYPEPSATHESKVIKTIVNDVTGEYINEFQISPINPSPNAKHLVVIHGYGAGLGFFIKNLEAWAESKPDWHIHAIDLLGYGCSSRPKFPYDEPYDNYLKIESWFVESLHTWFNKKGLNSNASGNGDTLVMAHSMGAYLSSLTNFKYPDLFSKLLLVSPAGVFSTNKPSIPAWFANLWNKNISPFVLVRNTGPLGSYFTSGWTSRRFSKDDAVLSAKEQELMHMYTYAIFNAKGSGEYMLNYMLAPGAVPRNPLLYRINNLTCDSVWYYGSHDWMDKMGGIRSCQRLNELGKKAEFVVVPGSGHHIYLDNFEEFNEMIVSEMNEFESKRK
ncbi:hypothetical protein CANARDRAFT_28765 [[Candida] arabinofermentans NRRL YB-2248]|uniref:AB hydrolase-1 domain-containing protein n=1 Tax=[Candida] arabinofermentans NRRL YB-2248 TaxID=983967 RepID=A0A1E4SZU4_9ASCO|nr:hypothetical protein CANARDRAFT_28765 [[Candida] arabinofermentans NRRL YB-2248]